MPWEITVVNYEGHPPASYRAVDRPDPKPLGSRREVVESIKAALPELEWGDSRSLPPEILQQFSAAIRELMSKPQLKAVYDGEDFSLELYGFEQEPVNYVHAEIRGNGNPLPFLARMCLRQRWSVVSNYDGSFVDLGTDSAAQWDYFRAWRDRAVGSLNEGGPPDGG